MRTGRLSQAELDAKLCDARGAKRRKILRELQRRYDETVPLFLGTVRFHGSVLYQFIPRYDFDLQHGEPRTS
ncbi:MAG: hypothetical protein V7609_2118 [Verrucomicrobiota bacterium]